MATQENINLAESAVVMATLSWIKSKYAYGPCRDRLQRAIQIYNKLLGISRLPLIVR